MGEDMGAPVIIKSQVIAKSKYFAIEEMQLRFHNGEERVYERLQEVKTQSVIILPMLDSSSIILVKEYAVGVDGYILGLPKGRLECGESHIEGANRELMEEIGYGARILRVLAELTLAPGHLCHKITVVLAENLYENRMSGDEPERLEVIKVSMNELDDLILRGEFTEARSLAALCMLKSEISRKDICDPRVCQ